MSDKLSYKTFEERFIYYSGKYCIDFTNSTIQNFYIFTEYLLEENAKYNLTSITEPDGIIVKHYIDSIAVLKHFDIPENSSIIDIGAGAGFPSVPIHIMRDDLHITYLDSSAKKINFIKSALDKLDKASDAGKNIFIKGRAEEAGKDAIFREQYDFTVSRAVARLNILCELAVPLIKPGGYFIAYKSKNAGEEIEEAKSVFKLLNLEIAEVAEFDISLKIDGEDNINNINSINNINNVENKRTLIKIKKLNKTPSKYPRNFSNITKNPL